MFLFVPTATDLQAPILSQAKRLRQVRQPALEPHFISYLHFETEKRHALVEIFMRDSMHSVL